ncbi:hypothetical protein Daus18300_009876 [Diaporthe australafricana]|uniref:Uncharacterized protein n=1 Tax=Diaporthe australafricana TaxID=127596 RepID=A0ABR3WCK8_9PEZI
MLILPTETKVAKDFRLEAENSVTHNFASEASGEVAPGKASIVTTAAVERMERWEAGFGVDHDIVVAYQLLKIGPKGWTKDRKLVVTEFHHRKAFLDDGQRAGMAEEGVDCEKEAVICKDLEDRGSKAELKQVGEV